MLTGAQRAAYDRDGFIVVPDVFSAEDIAELRQVTDEFVSASKAVTANDSIYDLEDTHSADEPRVRRLKAPHAIHPVYMRASRHPKIVELLTIFGAACVSTRANST
jgi:ectoine hydroxylase-related dioxygenase (phytanoyl-CoA dioxygenase family)